MGEVDALLAVASWLHGVGPMTVPEPRSEMAGSVLQQVRHPLLDVPVPASLDIGATAVLRHLASHGDLVIAATHDLEIAELLADLYQSLHFAEDLGRDGLRFDYLLRPGVTTGRTAIDLLEHIGYPAEVVAQARRLTTEFETSG